MTRQNELFAANESALVAIRGSAPTLGKVQKDFNRLSAQLRAARERLAAWEAYGPHYASRLAAEVDPAFAAWRATQRRFAQRIDEVLSLPRTKLSGRHRDTALQLIGELVDELLQHGPDAELAALHDKHMDVSLSDKSRMDLELTEAMMASMFGEDVVQGHEATSSEDLMAHVSARMRERDEADERARAERAAKRAKKRERPTRAAAAAERRAKESEEARSSLRDVYRQLVRALHPDRAADAAERERKTLLMQRANEAYERDDLLALLTLQIEIEQIDADRLAELPAERIKHFNRTLREQVEAVNARLREIRDGFESGVGAVEPIRDPQAADAAVSAMISNLQAGTAAMERDIEALADPGRRGAVLDRLGRGNASGMDAFEELVQDMIATSPRPPRKSRRR